MRYYILYNPLAGSGKRMDEVRMLDVIYEGEVIFQDLTQLRDVRSFLAGLEPTDVVVLCGGDGTLNRFANDTRSLELRNELRYFANGTGNDFLQDLGMTQGDEPMPINRYLRDLPTVTVKGQELRFINGVGFGIDGYCCQEGDRLRQQSDKPVNYTMIAIKGLLFHYRPTKATVTVDGQCFTYQNVWIAAAMKGRYYGGGMMNAPAQDRLDPEGKISLVLFHGAGRLKTLMVFPSIFKGTHINHAKQVATHAGRDITVRFDRPTPLQIDGETVLDVEEYRVHT